MRVVQNGFGNNFGLVGKNLRRYLTTTALTATSLMALASPALADNWTDMEYTAGGGAMDTSLANTTTFNQTTSSATMQGDADITSNWTVNINMGSSSDKVVVYDTENDPTHILGALNSNGRVYIFDRNGVIFGAGSQVNVGSIVASSGTIEDNTGTNGNGQIQFKDVDGGGAIELNGTISVADAGLAAFVAPNVSNSGVINAKVGNVVLASGNTVTLDLYGDGLVNVAVDGALENALVQNSGQINANGGNVVIAAQAAKGAVDSVINMSGIINVSSTASKGGKVAISGGNKGVVTVDGTINANGATGGGTVTVTGENILASDGSVISADAVTAGDGGSVVLLASDGLVFGGTATARGGALGGAGGFVDTSGQGWIDIYGSVDVSAFSGLNGTWLIDPANLEIVTGASSNVTGASPFSPTGGFLTSSKLQNTSIQNALNAGANVMITTVGSPNKLFQDGTITINADITKSSGADSTLKFESAAGIILNAGKTISASSGNILNVVMDAVGSGIISFKNIEINGAIKTNGGDVDLRARVGNIVIGNNGKIETNGGDIKTRADFLVPTALAGNPLTGGTVINGYVDAQGGSVDIQQSGIFKGAANSVRTTGTGTINLQQSNLLGIGGKIQNAIDAIQNTGTGTNAVKVSVGEYNEAVKADVDNLVLQGAWAGINPLLRILNPDIIETVIKPNSPGIEITADNVTVDGFVVTGATGPDGYGVWVNGAYNATVKNNVIKGNSSHGVLLNNGSTNGHVLSNRIYDLGGAVIDSANGIFADGVGNGFEAVGNIIDDIKGNGIYIKGSNGLINVKQNLIGTLATDAGVDGIWGDGVEIHDVNGNTFVQSNIITNTWDETDDNTNDDSSGVYLRQSSNIVVGGAGLLDGNLITDVDWDGIKMGGGTGNRAEGNIISDVTRIGIYGEGTNNATITKNSVTNANLADAGAITIRDGDDHTISYNFVTGPSSGADAGIMLHAGAGGNNLIQGNIVYNIKGPGIEVFDASDADILFNSVSKTQGDGIYLHNAFGNFNIAGNLINDIKGNGIYVKLVGGLINIKANLIGLLASDAETNGIWGDGIEIENVNGGTYVQSNIISNTWDPTKNNTNDNSSGIYLKQSSNIVVGGPDLLDGNLITNADWDGIKMAGGTGHLIQGNAISHSTRIGIYGEGTNDATIVDNLVYDSNLATWGGITLVDGGSHYVNNNVVWNDASSTGHHGIHLAGNYGDNEISDNWVYDVSHDGIRVENTTGTMEIDNNKIGTVDNGIWAKNVQGLVITDNLIDARFLEPGKGTFGIYVEDSDYAQIGGGLLSDTNYVEDFKTGIRVVTSTGAAVLGNIVNQFVDNGIHVTDSDEVDVKKNVVGLGDGNGILLENSDYAEINENGVALVGDNGIQVVDSHFVDILGNVVALTGGFGIYVDPSDFVEIGNNWVHFTGDDGIRLDYGVYGSIYDNHVGFTLGDGIEVVGNDAYISGNIVHHTLDNGILVTDTDYTTISENHVYRTGKNGIFTDNVGEVDVVRNHVTKAGWDGIHVSNFFDAFIGENHVTKSGDDGIEAHDGHTVEIDSNKVSKSGWGNWWSESYDEFQGGHDGISVRNIYGAYVEGDGEDEGDYESKILEIGDVWEPGSVRITNNGVGADIGDDEVEVNDENVEDQSENAKFASFYGDDTGVSRSADDGIEVVNVEGFAYIAGNSVEHSGVGALGIPFGGADQYGADGIHVRDVYLQDFYGLNPHYREGDIGNGEYNIVVSDNDVNNSLDDGIEVLGTARARYSERVALLEDYEEEYEEEEELPEYGDHTDGTYGEYEGQYETYGNTQRVLVSQNTVSNSGWGAPSEGYGQSDYWYSGGDGIHVENVYPAGYYYGEAGASESGEFYGYAVDVLDNTVDQSGDDGIDVEYVASTLIDHNTVTNSGWVGEGEYEGEYDFAKIKGYETGADWYGADGIFVNNVGAQDYRIPTIYEVEGPGDGYQEYSVVIRRNDVDNSLDDGIQVNNDMFYGKDTKSEYSVYDYYGYTAPVLVGGNNEGDGNNVTDSGFHGLYISGPGHNNVIVSGNAFANFDTGAQFESGLIDLTGATNTFDNGRIGLRFSPYLLGYSWPENEGEESVPYFAYLNLEDDDAPGSTPYPETPTNFGGTIGKQIFTGFKEEGDFYVYLDDYALTNDGTPIWLNGLNSTYDDITPSDTGGALSPEDYAFLEARFRHFPDAGAETADIFWFGFIPDDLFDINENLIFNEFAAFNGDVTGLNVRILGLPNTGNAGPGPAAFNNIQTFAGGNNPSDLNEIETAAGGNEGGNTPSELNEIETETGGENEACWGAAANAAGAGTAVNVVYGGSFDDNLNLGAACGTSF